MRIAVVVATRNRPRHVVGLLQSITSQKLQPVLVVVVQSSDAGLVLTEDALRCSGYDVRLENTLYASLPHQRNIGAQVALSESVDAVCFLDDDVRPHPDYLSRLADLIRRDTVGVVGGVGGTTGWTRTRLRAGSTAFNRLFLLTGPADGRVLRSGYNMPVDASTPGVHQAEWLFGCTMWRASVLRNYAFHEQLPGQALFEDVEFSVRIGRQHMLLVDSEAKIDHLVEMEGRPNNRKHYERSVRNRAEVIKALDNGRWGWAAFWWSVVGQALLLSRHAHSSPDYRQRLLGLSEGVVGTVRGRVPR